MSDKFKLLFDPKSKNQPSEITPTRFKMIYDATRAHVTSVSDKYYSSVGLVTIICKTRNQVTKEDNDNDDNKEPEKNPYLGYGTGTLIAPNLVLTCAHNTDLKRSEEYKVVRLTFSPGITKSDESFEHALRVKRWIVHDDYLTLSGSGDIAVLILEEDIVDREPVIYRVYEDAQLKNMWATITGYPGFFGQKEKLIQEFNETYHLEKEKTEKDFIPFMMRKSGLITKVNSELISYDISTSKGQSGSGVITQSQSTGRYFIVGVHFAGTESGPGSGVRISQSKLKWLDNIKSIHGSKILIERDIDQLLNIISKPKIDISEASMIAFEHLKKLFHLPEKFIKDAEKLITALETISESEQITLTTYKFINYYFNLASKLHAFLIEDDDSNLSKFRTLNKNIVDRYWNKGWFISRKILELEEVFLEKDEKNLRVRLVEEIIQSFKKHLILSHKSFIWVEKEIIPAMELTDMILTTLLKKIDDYLALDETDPRKAEFENKIIQGKLDKKYLDIPYSVIFGDDGGCYALLNSSLCFDDIEITENGDIISPENDFFLKILSDSKLLTIKYLSGKIIPSKENNKDPNKIPKNRWKVIIGKGTFGKVRFGLSLFDTFNTLPSKLICIKKYRVTTPASEENQGDNMAKHKRDLELMINTYSDYFASKSEINKIIYTPTVIDLSISNSKNYLMMELIPQKTGSDLFLSKESNCLDWSLYQKPYILDIFQKLHELLNNNIAFTDLKPENTLFDPDSRKATLIDLGGTVKLPDISKFNSMRTPSTKIFYTPYYTAPELVTSIQSNADVNVDLREALAFSCGKILEKIVDFTSTFREYDFTPKLLEIARSMTAEDSKSRLSIYEAIMKLRTIGEDLNQNKMVVSHYINNLKARIEMNRPSIMINEDIFDTKKLLIPIKVTPKDPDIYLDQKAEDLSTAIDNFLNKQVDHFIMIVLGIEGAGKSSYLQLSFIEAVQNWKEGNPIPIYINLASSTDFEKALENLDLELKTNIKNIVTNPDYKNKSLTLYLDSFDEGNYKSATIKKELVKDILNSIGTVQKIRILLTCRKYHSDYETKSFIVKNHEKGLTSDKIMPKECFITSFDYGSEQRKKLKFDNIEDKLKQEFIMTPYIKNLESKNANNHFVADTIKKIKNYCAEKYIFQSGMMFNLLIKLFLKTQLSSQMKIIRLVDIFEGNNQIYAAEELNKIISKYKFQNLEKKLQNGSNFSFSVCEKLARALHQNNITKLNNRTSENFFHEIFTDYTSKKPLKDQELFYILKLLPLKIEIRNSSIFQIFNGENINIGFLHDNYKNYFIYKIISSEFESSNNQTSSLFSVKSFVKDLALVNIFANAIHSKNGNSIKQALIKQIEYSKHVSVEDSDYERKVIASSNAATILIASGYSFSNYDFSNAIIKDANLSEGYFKLSNFTNSDLSNSDLTSANLNYCKFYNTNLNGINFSIHPDLNGHKSITCITYSPNNKFIATSSKDKTCMIWNAEDPQRDPITLKGHKDYVNHVSFSHDTKYLASSSSDRTCIVWDTTTWNILTIIQDHSDGLTCANFSPDGQFLATASFDKTCIIWKTQEWHKHKFIEAHKNTVNSVIFSPDKKTFATSSDDATCIIWELSTLKEKKVLKPELGEVKCAAYSIDGKNIITGHFRTCIVWKVLNGSMLMSLIGHKDSISCIQCSNDGNFIATSSWDNTIKIWSASSGLELKTLEEHKTGVASISFSPDGKNLASSSRNETGKFSEFMKISKPQKNIVHSDDITSVHFTPDGEKIISTSRDFTAIIWDSGTGTCMKTLHGHEDWILQAAISKDGKILATCSSDETGILWDLSIGIAIKVLSGHSNNVTSIAFSPNDANIATSSWDNTCIIWDASSGAIIKQLSGHDDRVLGVKYSSDDKHLASCSRDGKIIIWDLNDFSIKMKYEHGDEMTCIDFSPDGNYIAGGSRDDLCFLWRITDKLELILTLSGHESIVNGVSFSPDGNYLATCSADSFCILWDAKTGARIKTLEEHIDEVSSLAFSPDGNYLVTCGERDKYILWNISYILKHYRLTVGSDFVCYSSYEKMVCLIKRNCYEIWDLEKFALIPSLQDFGVIITYAAFSPDSKSILLSFEDKSLKIIEIKSHKVISEFRNSLENIPCDMRFSHDGKYLAICQNDDKCKILEISFGQICEIQDDKNSSIYLSCFSPDLETIATCSTIGIKLWDLKTGRLKKVLNIEYEGNLLVLKFDSSGNYLEIYCKNFFKMIISITTSEIIGQILDMSDKISLNFANKTLICRESGLFKQNLEAKFAILDTKLISATSSMILKQHSAKLLNIEIPNESNEKSVSKDQEDFKIQEENRVSYDKDEDIKFKDGDYDDEIDDFPEMPDFDLDNIPTTPLLSDQDFKFLDDFAADPLIAKLLKKSYTENTNLKD